MPIERILIAILVSTIGVLDNSSFTASGLTLFGERPEAALAEGETENAVDSGADFADQAFFTGKPNVEELGYAFLFRNYRAENAKWQTADPLGYPDGWNQMAYCNNEVNTSFDYLGLDKVTYLYIQYIGRMRYFKTTYQGYPATGEHVQIYLVSFTRIYDTCTKEYTEAKIVEEPYLVYNNVTDGIASTTICIESDWFSVGVSNKWKEMESKTEIKRVNETCDE